MVSEARRRAAIAVRFTDDLIGLIEARGPDMLEERQIDAVIDALMRGEIGTVEALREQDGPRSPEASTAAIRVHEATRETLRAALVYNDYQAVHAPLECTFARLGFAPPEADGDWRRIGRRAARALVEVAGENIYRGQGIYLGDARLSVRPDTMNEVRPMREAVVFPAPPTGQMESALPARAASAPGRGAPPPERPGTVPVPNPAGDEPAKPRQSAPRDRPGAMRPAPHAKVVRRAETAEDPFAVDVADLDRDSPFSDRFAAAICAKREQSPDWDPCNLNNWRSTKKLLIEAFGDRPIGCYAPALLREFHSLLQALPKTHRKGADAPGLHRIIEEAEAEEAHDLALAENEIARARLNRGEAEQARARARVVRLRVATVYQHMQALQFVFRLAADHRCAPANLMRGVIWTKKQLDRLQAEEKDRSRLPWGDKLADLLATTAFRSPVADGNRAVF